jgi:hypothetical protein
MGFCFPFKVRLHRLERLHRMPKHRPTFSRDSRESLLATAVARPQPSLREHAPKSSRTSLKPLERCAGSHLLLAVVSSELESKRQKASVRREPW